MMSGNSELAGQFDRFARRVIDPHAEIEAPQAPRRSRLGFEKIASIW